MAATPSPAPAKILQLRQEPKISAQMNLLPLRVEAAMPSTFESADLKHLVMTHDRHYYAIKSLGDHPLLPASEFICYKLAAACNLSVPFSSLIEISPSELAFGSRFEGGLNEWKVLGPARQFAAMQASCQPLSGVLAFDLFVGNEDRHLNNFVWRKNVKDEWVPFAIDYSRAFLVRGFPFDEFPVSRSSNTRLTLEALKRAQAWQAPYALFTLQQLQNVKRENLEHWFDEMPTNWLSLERRNGILEWWDSPEFGNRLNAIFDLL
jgi:hypothetical protein